ncbi:MAG TPA: DUF928 domain-containing protein [Cyanophyceae cyanobacterium]
MANHHCRSSSQVLGLIGISILFLSSFSSLAQAQTLPKSQIQISAREPNFLKCGYRKKGISLNLQPNMQKDPNHQSLRVEQNSLSRCADYSPEIPLTALTPPSSRGISMADYPTVLVYIPDVALEGLEGKFILRNEKDDVIYSKKIPLKVPDSIISIAISDDPDLPPLDVGKSYLWEFMIIFDQEDWSDSTYVGGSIERVAPNSDLNVSLKAASPEARPAIYATHGIWYEAVATLAQLRCSAPNDLTIASDWESLLKQVGLPEISTKFLDQCTSN